ncbi:transposase [Gluconobacter oxydans H24]|nr:transposase [Gluconobacter oxydans H24]
MKKARFTQDQIIGRLKEHQAGATAADLCAAGTGSAMRPSTRSGSWRRA